MKAPYRRTAAGWVVELGDQHATFISLAELGKWAREHDVELVKGEEEG